MIYLISCVVFKFLLQLFFRFEVTGGENIPKKGPFIAASNHVSYLDPIVLGAACNTMPLRFMAKAELFDVPVLGAWIKAVGCIPIERRSGSFAPIKKAVKKLNEGEALGIFPEGMRSADGELQKAMPGIGIIALKTKAPIIPFYIVGTKNALPIGRKMPWPCTIRAKVGKAVDIGRNPELAPGRKAYEYIGEKVMAAISLLQNESRDKERLCIT